MRGGEDMLTSEDMKALAEADEKRLGINSPEFMAMHNEIMAMIDNAQSRYKKSAPAGTANTGRDE